MRYFPELRFPRGRYVLDGEIVIFGDDGLQEFDALSNRIHPAASRIARLAEETPARFVAFDLLAREDEVAAGAAVRGAPRGAGGVPVRSAGRADAVRATASEAESGCAPPRA